MLESPKTSIETHIYDNDQGHQLLKLDYSVCYSQLWGFPSENGGTPIARWRVFVNGSAS